MTNHEDELAASVNITSGHTWIGKETWLSGRLELKDVTFGYNPCGDPLIDGFGLIAFASLLPMIIVMSYGMLATWWLRSKNPVKEKRP